MPSPATNSNRRPIAYLHLERQIIFSYLWIQRDSKAGLTMISPGLRREGGDDALKTYMQGLSDPFHVGFMIGAGETISKDRFRFSGNLL